MQFVYDNLCMCVDVQVHFFKGITVMQIRTEECAMKIEDLEDDRESYAYWILSTLVIRCCTGHNYRYNTVHPPPSVSMSQ